MNSISKRQAVNSTAGAIPVRNEKGQITMEKVKVPRYVTGKRPQYAPRSSDDEYDDDDDDSLCLNPAKKELLELGTGADDRRLSRLTESAKPERLSPRDDDGDNDDDDDGGYVDGDDEREDKRTKFEVKEEVRDDGYGGSGDGDNEEDEEDEEEIQKRRDRIRAKALIKIEMKEEAEFGTDNVKDEPNDDDDGDDDEEFEEYTDSDDYDDDGGNLLKPVFIKKEDRKTPTAEGTYEDKELEVQRLREEMRLETLRRLEAELKRETEEEKERIKNELDALNTGDENDEEEYEAWKVRELKRRRKEREQRESLLREREEVDRRRNLTEEEKAQEDKLNPKLVVNRAVKGKYKYLQKYYHRGAFYLDREDDVFKRDFSAPTLEDHFDRAALPKVMQVKNFGRAGRSKYTHLKDQDTTQFDSPWMARSQPSG